MLTGGRLRGAVAAVLEGVVEFGPDGGLAGEDMMCVRYSVRCLALCMKSNRQVSMSVRVKVEAASAPQSTLPW